MLLVASTVQQNEVIQEVDREHISDAAQNHLDKLQQVIIECIPILLVHLWQKGYAQLQ